MITPLFTLGQTVYPVVRGLVTKGTIAFVQTTETKEKTEIKYGVLPYDSDKVLGFDESELYLTFKAGKAKSVELWDANKKKYDDIILSITEESLVVPEVEVESDSE